MGLTSSLYKTAQLKSAHIDVNLKVTILLVTMWNQDCKHFSIPLKQKISSSSSITHEHLLLSEVHTDKINLWKPGQTF